MAPVQGIMETPHRVRSAAPAETDSTTVSARLRASVIVGGTISKAMREEAAAGLRPRLDVLELEAALAARVHDFGTARQDSSLSLARQILPHIRNDDVVYTTGEDVGLPLAALLRLYSIDRPRLVMRLEEPLYGRTILRKLGFMILTHYALRRVDRVLCRSTAHLQYLHSAHRVPLKKLSFVPEPVDTDFYAPEATDNLATIGPQIPSDPYIVSAGLEMRDYPTLIDAVRGSPINLVIAAGSPWSHSSFGGAIQQPLPSNVHVASYTPSEMRDLYRGARFVVVAVQPSLRTCGISVALEAWAMTKAVIVSRTAGLLDYVIDGHSGMFVPPNDSVTLRTKISELLDDPDRAEELGRNGRRQVEARFRLGDYVDRVRRSMLDPDSCNA